MLRLRSCLSRIRAPGEASPLLGTYTTVVRDLSYACAFESVGYPSCVGIPEGGVFLRALGSIWFAFTIFWVRLRCT